MNCGEPIYVFLGVINTAAAVLSAGGFILVGVAVLIAVLRPAQSPPPEDES